LLTGSQGTGKTRTELEVLVQLIPPANVAGDLVVHHYAPRLDKAVEFASDYAGIAGAASLPVKVVRGRGAKDPERGGGTEMCPRHAVVTRAAQAGIQVRKAI
jgi:hypothetical protein